MLLIDEGCVAPPEAFYGVLLRMYVSQSTFR